MSSKTKPVAKRSRRKTIVMTPENMKIEILNQLAGVQAMVEIGVVTNLVLLCSDDLGACAYSQAMTPTEHDAGSNGIIRALQALQFDVSNAMSDELAQESDIARRYGPRWVLPPHLRQVHDAQGTRRRGTKFVR